MSKTSDWLLSFKKDVRSEFPLSSGFCQKISITGGKGGVGKTSIAVKTARTLASQGHKVLLIDCDTNLSNTSIKLNLPLNNTFWKLLSAEKNFEDCLYREGNFHLLAACNGSLDLFESKLNLDEIIIDIINSHEDEYDYILLDCPAGLSRESLTLNAYCDHRFLVVTPDKSSITDSYSLVKILFQKFGIKENHLIVNMMTSQSQYQRVCKTLSETIENFIGARTYILGGVQKAQVNQESFDTFFLANANNEIHEEFFKMTKNFTDKWGVSSAAYGNFNVPTERMTTQEVF
jgi:flagellar biosynthesis protein FlhG